MYHMAKTRGVHTTSPSTRNPRPRASLMRDSTSEAPQASAIPPSEGTVPSSPSQRRVALDFYQSMSTHRIQDLTVIHFTIHGRHGILGARHIVEALHIPYEPAQQAEMPIEIIPPTPAAPSIVLKPEATSSTPPTTPEAPPVVPTTSAPLPSESSITISSSEFRGLCHTLQTLSTTQEPTAPSEEATPAEQTMPHEETTTAAVETPIQSTQETTTEPSSPHDHLTTT
ncbi:hypothetical protein CK203_116795 [Vitis vinifera]|uniref:Uncharacterized protein n=1 Tax=Vitis vinifera TaxID=29760 RepID=A0A438CA73_VITVI|nr:hypothetical protein CK203_116795 [Vitis vinifera]